ncbi:hypothetical protein KBZ10_11125 [Streptomyces sp. F63]|uniref:hypothetical protein n=1 Tax=Streptomyces sp. F63 TaxID=2824887 RepID=UPI001B391F63|nr:hypothetical protein [Streptomyces sp. F63]MBQ0985059.1 hypothetical protein [Streptomyces sp. F63]
MSKGIIFDHHALTAAGSGNRLLSAYIVRAHSRPDYTIAAPAMCVAEAVRHRAGVSPHLAQFPGVDVHTLDRITADACGRLAQALWPADGWPAVHAAMLATTTGWEIATTRPGTYKGFGVAVMPVAE